MHSAHESLNPEQLEAVKKTEGPVLILAGAGSGKTRTIVHRIAYLIHEKEVPPWKIVAVTFTNKAAQEMQERAMEITGEQASQCMIRTYHSFGLYLLRCHASYINYPSNFTIWDSIDRNSIIDNIVCNKLGQSKKNKNQIKYLSNIISTFKDLLISPDRLVDEMDMDELEFGEILPQLYLLYEEQKKRAFAIDFDDMIYQNVKLFESQPELLNAMHTKYQYFMIDEYQDTNKAQYVFIQLLVQSHQNICVVGDDDQAIYGWRGADVNNILDFNKDFPDTHVVKLEQNYRSHQSILNIANGIIQHNADRIHKELWTNIKKGTKPQLMVLPNPVHEASLIAEMIHSLTAQIPYDEIGILYRTNAQSRLIEEALLTKNIAYRIYGGISFFDRKEIKDILAYLCFLVNPNDEAAFIRMVNMPTRGIGQKSIDKIYQHREQNIQMNYLELMENAHEIGLSAKATQALLNLSSWMQKINEKIDTSLNLNTLLEQVLEKSGLLKIYTEEDKLLDSQRVEHIEELRNSICDFQQKKPTSFLSEYLQEISLYTSSNVSDTATSSVNLMTIHHAKGLEFEVVFILSLDDDVIPHYLSKKELRYDEERRLLYVAITRAKSKLYMMRCLSRINYGCYTNTLPSMFLNEIESSGAEYEIMSIQ